MADHDAAAAALGYMYQVRWALLALIRESPARPDLSITLELHDDVAFEVSGAPAELLQVKHHASALGLLGDKSVDVWKTLKVWMDGKASRRPGGPILSLVTTSMAQEGSAMGLLRPLDRDPAEALRLLNDAATTSTNRTTLSAREQWLTLNSSDRYEMVLRIQVYDGEVAIADVDEKIREALALSAPFGHEDPYFDQLFEWWNRVSIDMLRKKTDSISGIDLRSRMSDIRDFFRADNLPTTIQLGEIDEEALQAEYGNHRFVNQLRWVDVNLPNLRKAVVDYHRAVTQTTKWLDDSLIGVSEIQSFEDRLVDEWQRAFADMVQDLGPEADAVAQAAAGRDLFRALSNASSISIRALYGEAFYARGKRHELANAGQVGWHPNFEALLSELISTS